MAGGEENSIDQTAAVIPEESTGDPVEGADANQASSSTNQSRYSSSNPDKKEDTSVVDYISELRRQLCRLEEIMSSNGSTDAPSSNDEEPSTRPQREPAFRTKKMVGGEETGGSRAGSSNSIDQTVAVIPEESTGDPVEGTAANQALNSTNRSRYSSSNPDEKEEMSVVDFIFELRRQLCRLEEISSSNGSTDAPASNDEEPSTRPPREPASRSFPPECYCFMKRLTLTDASHEDGKLDLDPLKAIWIPSCPQIPKDIHEARESVELMVFDYENTLYDMVLTGYNYEGIVLYSISGEWRNFTRTHNLQQGDMIFFLKNRDRTVNADGFYYIILFSRKSDGDFKFGDGDGNNNANNNNDMDSPSSTGEDEREKK